MWIQELVGSLVNVDVVAVAPPTYLAAVCSDKLGAEEALAGVTPLLHVLVATPALLHRHLSNICRERRH